MTAHPGSAVSPAHQPDGGPTAIRIIVGRRLRELRERAGVSREAAGSAIRGSTAKISRLELGRVGLKPRDVDDLLVLYRAGAEEREKLVALAHRSNQRPWWQEYADLLPAWFETFLGLEQAVTTIRSYECQYVPGLLQTADYARAVVSTGYDDPVQIQRRVELRMRRQELLDGPHAPVYWSVMDQAVLSQLVGRPDFGRGQLRHLLEAFDRPNVRIQIAGFEHGGLPAASGAFAILRFGLPELADVVYLEQLTTSQYLDKRSDLDLYLGIMDRLVAQIHTPERSRELIAKLYDGLGSV